MLSILSNLSKLTRLNLYIALLLLGLFSIYRLTFWWVFDNQTTENNELLYAFYLGLKFDWRLAILVVLPILLFGWIKWFHPLKNKIAGLVWRVYLSLTFGGLVLIYFLDFGHYAYLKIHLNKTIFRFIDDWSSASEMVWQSYPIVLIILFFAFLVFLFSKIVKFLFAKVDGQAEYSLKLWQKIIVNTMIVVLVFFSLLAKMSWYPLRWSDAFFSDNTLVADVAQNPVLYGYDTLRYSDTDYDIEQVKQHFPLIKQYLKIPNNEELNFQRPLVLTPEISGATPNIVLVFLESFAGYKTGTYNNPLASSNHFDKLVKDSVFFDKFYVAHTGTARSVFANITGLVDTQLVKTATRNPLIVNQNTLVNAFKDYKKLYFLGGSANWGNIRGVLGKNIKDLSIYEAGNFNSPRQDVWGISDADLFLEANAVFKQQKQPFLGIVQTSGNHRPYTIPDPNYDFKPLDLEQKTVTQYGFESLEELNSFRFMDHSIGLFIKSAKAAGYYDNTIFVFYADHGINANNGKHRPAIETQLNIGSYLVPLVIHAPKFLKPKVNSTVTSHIDMMAIIAGITGHSSTNTTLGRNMLAPKYQDQQYAFFIDHGVIPTIGIIGKKYLFKMRSDGQGVALYDLNKTQKAVNISQQQAKISKKMQALTQGIYQTSKYLLYHNQKVDNIKTKTIK